MKTFPQNWAIRGSEQFAEFLKNNKCPIVTKFKGDHPDIYYYSNNFNELLMGYILPEGYVEIHNVNGLINYYSGKEMVVLTKQQLINLVKNARNTSNFELELEYDSDIQNWINVQLEPSNAFKLECEYVEGNEFEKI